jgi:hypothetical protein
MKPTIYHGPELSNMSYTGYRRFSDFFDEKLSNFQLHKTCFYFLVMSKLVVACKEEHF